MKWQVMSEEGVPEVNSEEEVSEFELSTENSEVALGNISWCCSMTFGFVIGIVAVVEHDEVLDEDPVAFGFTVFFLLVEIFSSIFASFIVWFWCMCSYCQGRKPSCTDYVGVFSVCTITVSHFIHLTALPTGPWLLAYHSELPIIYRVYISYQTLIALILFIRMLRHFFKKDISPEHAHVAGTFQIPEDDIRRAESEIREIRSRSTSLEGQMDLSFKSSFQGRFIRSTSNYTSHSLQTEEGRQRSVSDYPKLSLRLRSSSTSKKLYLAKAIEESKE